MNVGSTVALGDLQRSGNVRGEASVSKHRQWDTQAAMTVRLYDSVWGGSILNLAWLHRQTSQDYKDANGANSE